MLGYFTFISNLAAAIDGGAALPGKRPAEHRSANACIASDRRFHAWSIQLRRPFFAAVGTTAEAKKKSRKLKDILAQDERVVKIGKNWDGRPSRRFIQPKMKVSLHRRPLPKENQKTPAFGRGTRRPPGGPAVRPEAVDEKETWFHKNSVSGTNTWFNRPTSRPYSTFFMTHERSLNKSPNSTDEESLISITPSLTDRETLISNTGSGIFVLQMDFQQIELF